MSFTYKATQSQKPLKDGSRTISIRITKDRKIAYVNTGVKVIDSHWNENATYEKGNWVRVTNPMHAVYNKTIKDTIQKCEKLGADEMSSDDLKAQVEGKNEDRTMFLAFALQLLETQKPIIAVATYVKDISRIKKFKSFLKDKDIAIEKVNYELIKQYESWIIANGHCQNTAGADLSVIRKILNEAVRTKRLKVDDNPFLVFKIKSGAVDKKPLSVEDIIKLQELPLERVYGQTQMFNSRNMFLVQFFCAGARISDVICMKFEDIKDGRWIYITRKSGSLKPQRLNIQLHEQVIDILKHYGYGERTEGYVFPFIKPSNYTREGMHKKIKKYVSYVDRNLKKVALRAGIDKPISSHISRHTHADISRLYSHDLVAISMSMGHSSIKMTQNYWPNTDQNSVDKIVNVVSEATRKTGNV